MYSDVGSPTVVTIVVLIPVIHQTEQGGANKKEEQCFGNISHMNHDKMQTLSEGCGTCKLQYLSGQLSSFRFHQMKMIE